MLPQPHHALVNADDDDLQELLRDAARGDETAFSAFYDRTSALVNGLALRITRDASLAEDVTLDVFTQAWRTAERYDPIAGAPVAWLLNMTRSRAIDRLRAQHGPELGDLDLAAQVPSAGPGPEEGYALTQRRGIVVEALMRLAPDRRRVVELAYFSGLSHTQIAARLDQPLGTVKSRVRLGMQELRRRLGRSGRELL